MTSPRPPQRTLLTFWIVVLLLLALVATLADSGLGQSIAVLILWVLPMLTWARILRGTFAERLITAAGLGVLFNALFMLLLNYLPGPIAPTYVAVSASIVTLLPLWWPTVPLKWQLWSPRVDFLLVGIIAAAFRFGNIGYKEIQGDEGIVLVRVASALMGQAQQILMHQKGPMEILLPMAQWGITGEISDFWLRVPFAWVSILAVIAIMLLADRWFGSSIAMICGLLFAINGFGIAFAHIIQYQSLVMFFGAVALLKADDYRKDSRAGDLYLCALFVAGGLLAHYDMVLVLPAIGWTLLLQPRPERNFKLRDWIFALALGLFAALSFYLPYMLSPGFGRTLNYVLNDRVGVSGESFIGWGAPQVWRMITFYNSTYYIVGLIILIALGLIFIVRERVPVASLLYWLVPVIFYVFFVTDPRTHVYTLFPGATILAALGLFQTWQWLTPEPDFSKPDALKQTGGRAKTMAAAIFAVWFFISSIYVYMVFVDTTPERQRTWQTAQPRFFPVTWDEPPEFGLFGFPYQAGWRVAAEFIDEPYASNEEEEITNWYTGQAYRTHCPDLATFLLAENVQDEIAWHPALLEEMHLNAIITVNDRQKLRVYKREPTTYIPDIEASEFERWLRPEQVAPPKYAGLYPLNINLGNQVRLAGYDIDNATPQPGDTVTVTLYWNVLAPFNENYQSFVHLTGTELIAQHDGAPECGINPTTRWEAGQTIPDAHVLQIPSDAVRGEPLKLQTGMYGLLSLERLPVAGSAENIITLTEIELR